VLRARAIRCVALSSNAAFEVTDHAFSDLPLGFDDGARDGDHAGR
jgi:hypothetical protein